MFYGIIEKLLGMTDAVPIRIGSQASVFRRASVSVFPGFGFQVAFKVSGITCGDVGQSLVGTESTPGPVRFNSPELNSSLSAIVPSIAESVDVRKVPPFNEIVPPFWTEMLAVPR